MKTSFYIVLISLALSSCTLERYIWFNYADIDDHKIFPYTEIDTGMNKFHFQEGDTNQLRNYISPIENQDSLALDDYLRNTSTTAFLVIRNDSILFENYYNGYKQSDISTIFSVSKSITSMLVGLAVDDGLIESVQDPVTRYIPELKKSDPKFKKLSIENLLNMRSGLKYDESYSNPFSNMAHLYYGLNQLKQIRKMKFECEPGEKHNYQSVSTALLGMIVERVTNKEQGKYLEEKIWQPLGMEYKASWSLDDRRHRSAKAYSGLNTTARDLAKIARLYLNKGKWDDKRILSEEWVEKSITPNMDNDAYQYQWYSEEFYKGTEKGKYFTDSISAYQIARERKYEHFRIEHLKSDVNKWYIHVYKDFSALGLFNQIIYVRPEKNLIVIRLGKGGDKNYFGIIKQLIRQI